jgi:hypothetical protein
LIRDLISLGKQLHPYQIPAFKNSFQILSSIQIAFAISFIFAHTLSESLAISLINVIFVAKKLFAAYFISSAVCQSVLNTGIFLSIKLLYTILTFSIVFISSKSQNQKTILSGAKKSLIASHSLKNSGLETTLFFLSNNS